MAVVGIVLLVTAVAARGTNLYSTSFDNPPFDPATGYWAGVDGWQASDPSNGSAAVVAGGGAVYLGYVAPAGGYSTVWRPFGLDVLGLNAPILKIHTRLGIVDSTNSHYDGFGFSIYNRTGDLLCRFLFDNSNNQLDFDSGSGALEVVPGRFANGQYYAVELTLNFATSRATLTLYDGGGTPHTIFENRAFNAAGRALDFGAFDYLWLLNNSGTAGDNAMQIDSLSIDAEANPTLVLARGPKQRTRRPTYVLRGGQPAGDAVRIEWKTKDSWRWKPVSGSPTQWKIRLKRLRIGRTVVHFRLLDVLGRTIDQKNVTVLRR